MNLEKFFSEDNTTNDKTTKPDSNTKNDVELVEEDNGQFSLFGGVTEKGQKKKTNSKTTSTKNKASKNSKQKSTVNLKITGEWTIHYATHTFNVTDFISIPDGEHVSPEDIRKEMEKEFSR